MQHIATGTGDRSILFALLIRKPGGGSLWKPLPFKAGLIPDVLVVLREPPPRHHHSFVFFTSWHEERRMGRWAATFAFKGPFT